MASGHEVESESVGTQMDGPDPTKEDGHQFGLRDDLEVVQPVCYRALVRSVKFMLDFFITYNWRQPHPTLCSLSFHLWPLPSFNYGFHSGLFIDTRLFSSVEIVSPTHEL